MSCLFNKYIKIGLLLIYKRWYEIYIRKNKSNTNIIFYYFLINQKIKITFKNNYTFYKVD
jgi:hypothetical protein